MRGPASAGCRGAQVKKVLYGARHGTWHIVKCLLNGGCCACWLVAQTVSILLGTTYLLLLVGMGCPFCDRGDRTQQQLLGPGSLWLMSQFTSFILQPLWAMEWGRSWSGAAQDRPFSGIFWFPFNEPCGGGVRPLVSEEEASELPWKGCCVSGFCFMSRV